MAAELDARSDWAIDGWGETRSARAADPDDTPLLYYTEDSHWTPSGALPAIRALIRSLGPDLWREDDVVVGGRKRVVMELARQMGLRRAQIGPGVTIRPTVTITRDSDALPVKTNNARDVSRFVATGDRPLVPGLTVIAYDSFFGLNMAAIAPFFEESIWIHQGDLFNHPEIASLVERADLVILERVERGLYTTRIDDLVRPLVRGPG
jgi:hypothetical protein